MAWVDSLVFQKTVNGKLPVQQNSTGSILSDGENLERRLSAAPRSVALYQIGTQLIRATRELGSDRADVGRNKFRLPRLRATHVPRKADTPYASQS
jgi:hypothetical protein